MRMGFGLNIEQTQKLIMTPELRQAITILQLSAVDLAEYIEEQLLENPCLEVKEDHTEKGERETVPEGEAPVRNEDKFDIDWQEYFADTSDLGFVNRGQGGDREEVGFDYFLTQAPTLQEHLSFQLSLAELGKKQQKIGEFIIGNIDEHGYFRSTLEEVADYCHCSIAEAEEILNTVQGFDPPGVGARSLTECLLIQVAALNIENSVLDEIIKNYLHELAAGKIQKIAKVLHVSLREVQEAADILKTLDPKPGRKFSDGKATRYIVPDIVVERVCGEYIVLVNDVTVPRLGINNTYKQILSGDSGDRETRKFVEAKLNAASWLVKSIEQRRLTLYKVADCIVRMQRDFLDHGIKWLKPMNLRQVAESVGLHESTVSRATSNKYMQTPQGVFEMKYFFSSGVDSKGGEMVSSESIKKMLREMVEQENHGKPLSDQKMADILNGKGINISRRTVAKYREEMGVPAAGKRKRY